MLSSDVIEMTELQRNKPTVLREMTVVETTVETDGKIEEEYPEGGLAANLVALGSLLGCIVNLGIINSIGAIQAYVSTHQLVNLSASSISWIFSIYLALAYMVGIFIGPLFDKYGPKHLMAISSLLWIVGFMGAASSTKVLHFIFSFISLGLGNGIGMTPCISVLSHWFLKNRGNYTGIATSGGSIGGLVFPLMLRHTYVAYGYPWAIRILGFVCFGCMVLATLLVRSRFTRDRKSTVDSEIPGSKWKRISTKLSIESLHKFKDRTYLAIVGGAFFAELSLVLLVTYFASYAIANGASESTGYLLITVWNGVGIAGRWIPGYFSDKIGRFNMNVMMLVLYTMSVLIILLPFGKHIGAMYAFAGIGGFFSGSILTLLPSCLGQVTPVKEMGEKYGMLNGVLSLANLFGVPIASAVIDKGTPKDYTNFVVFVGCLAVMGTGFWTTSRVIIAGVKLNSKV
jgi:MFS family permease